MFDLEITTNSILWDWCPYQKNYETVKIGQWTESTGIDSRSNKVVGECDTNSLTRDRGSRAAASVPRAIGARAAELLSGNFQNVRGGRSATMRILFDTAFHV